MTFGVRMVHDEPLRQMAALFTVYVLSVLKTCKLLQVYFALQRKAGAGMEEGLGERLKEQPPGKFPS